MSRKTQFILLIVIAVVVIALAAVFIAVYFNYNSTYFAESGSFEENYSYRNGILYSETGNKAMLYTPEGGIFTPFEPFELSLEEYSLDGSFRYFLIDDTIVPLEEQYNYFYAANTANRFTYIANDGKKYSVSITDGTAVPLFDGSAEDIDPYAENICALSPDGGYAAEIGENAFVFYQLGSNGDTEVTDRKVVEFTADMQSGKPECLGFVNSDTFFFRVNGRYYICSVSGGEIADCYIDDSKNYKDTAVSRHFVEEIISDEELSDEKNANSLIIRYIYLFSGNSFEVRLEKALYDSAELIAVSPNGMYAALKVTAHDGANARSGLMIYRIGEKCAVMDSFVPEISEAQDISFIFNNILFVNYSDGAKSYKVCY